MSGPCVIFGGVPAEELGAHADAARAREALLVQRLKVAVEADKIFVATVVGDEVHLYGYFKIVRG